MNHLLRNLKKNFFDVRIYIILYTLSVFNILTIIHVANSMYVTMSMIKVTMFGSNIILY